MTTILQGRGIIHAAAALTVLLAVAALTATGVLLA